MTLLSFPDVNIWVALAVMEHTHHEPAVRWWSAEKAQTIAFSRFTQIGMLRLLTSATVMKGQPLSMRNAWSVYDRLSEDERVKFLLEPPQIERPFRQHSSTRFASPNLWADAYLVAMAEELGATLVTFDSALARRCKNSVLLP
jgi:hypothetical protein